ncbi:hypothetical protein AB0E85_37600 [Streptomyces sp. NPDC029044]
MVLKSAPPSSMPRVRLGLLLRRRGQAARALTDAEVAGGGTCTRPAT